MAAAHAMAAALLCGLTVAGLALAFKTGALSSTDRQTELHIHKGLHGSLDGVMTALTSVGASWPMAVLALGCAVFCLLQSGPWVAGLVVACPTGASVLDTALKHLIQRHRPHLWSHAAVLNSYSFPSGHATMSSAFFAGATYAVWKLMGPARGRAAAAISIVFVAGIGFSRVYLGVHWPSDILAGYALGLGWALVLIAIAESFRGRRGTDPAWSSGEDRNTTVATGHYSKM
jgi:undecaprenyl-diphosphatase